MSIFGYILGYDCSGHDLLGVHQNSAENCIVCGVSCWRHTKEMEIECVKKLWARPEQQAVIERSKKITEGKS
jgi:hypothetical protein